MASTTTAAPPSAAPPSSSSSKPPIEIHPTAHLDPNAYVRGTHAILLGPGVLIHPRAMLISIHGPLIINDGAVIMEKCVVGGPVPPASSSSAAASTNLDNEEEDQGDLDPIKTVIGSDVLVMAHAHVHAGAMVHDAATIESHVTVARTGVVGKHAKVCGGGGGSATSAGVVVADTVGDWEVVFGGSNGSKQQRRKRLPLEEVEEARLKAMRREREATIGVLRTSARAPVLRKR